MTLIEKHANDILMDMKKCRDYPLRESLIFDVIVKALREQDRVSRGYNTITELTDNQCDELRRLPGSFNDMLRKVHECGRMVGATEAVEQLLDMVAPDGPSIDAIEDFFDFKVSRKRPVEDFKPIKWPVGTWDLNGHWYHNPLLVMSRNDQRDHNIKHGYMKAVKP